MLGREQSGSRGRAPTRKGSASSSSAPSRHHSRSERDERRKRDASKGQLRADGKAAKRTAEDAPSVPRDAPGRAPLPPKGSVNNILPRDVVFGTQYPFDAKPPIDSRLKGTNDCRMMVNFKLPVIDADPETECVAPIAQADLEFNNRGALWVIGTDIACPGYRPASHHMGSTCWGGRTLMC